MKPLILAIVMCCGALGVRAAVAAPDYPVAGSTSNKLVESVDSGGGGAPSRAAAPSVRAMSADHGSGVFHEAASNADSDPSAPIAATPRRPTYRWQSLVPGAIK